MNTSKRTEELLQCLIHIIGRAAIPEDRVREVVETGGKQVKAFNLSDGTRTQSEIAKKAGLDKGNLSRAIGRWIENGVAYWVGAGKEARLLHVYAIPVAHSSKSTRVSMKRRKSGRRR